MSKAVVSISIGGDVFEHYKFYAEIKETTVEKVIAYALWDWMISVGHGHLDNAKGECQTAEGEIQQLERESNGTDKAEKQGEVWPSPGGD